MLNRRTQDHDNDDDEDDNKPAQAEQGNVTRYPQVKRFFSANLVHPCRIPARSLLLTMPRILFWSIWSFTGSSAYEANVFLGTCFVFFLPFSVLQGNRIYRHPSVRPSRLIFPLPYSLGFPESWFEEEKPLKKIEVRKSVPRKARTSGILPAARHFYLEEGSDPHGYLYFFSCTKQQQQ